MRNLKFLFCLAGVSFTLHFIWESSHIELYAGYENLSPYFPITVWATIGDVFYTLGAVFLFAIFKRSFVWVKNVKTSDYFFFALIGFFISVFVEYKALLFGRWHYLETMPIVPLFNVGLSPVLQMTILLPLSIFLADKFSKKILKERAT